MSKEILSKREVFLKFKANIEKVLGYVGELGESQAEYLQFMEPLTMIIRSGLCYNCPTLIVQYHF